MEIYRYNDVATVWLVPFCMVRMAEWPFLIEDDPFTDNTPFAKPVVVLRQR